MTTDSPVKIEYFSDVLCIWAYLTQIKLDRLQTQCGARLALSYHFIPVFGDVACKIQDRWGERGGLDAYNAHVRDIAARHDYVEVHPDVWRAPAPPSSGGCHLVLKAAQLLEQDGTIACAPVADYAGHSIVEEAMWRMRLAFFRDNRNIAELDTQLDVARECGLPLDAIRARLDDGTAHAALCADLEARDRYLVQGSPTFVLNEGRQKLYGNIGFRAIMANVQELMEHPHDRASWC